MAAVMKHDTSLDLLLWEVHPDPMKTREGKTLPRSLPFLQLHYIFAAASRGKRGSFDFKVSTFQCTECLLLISYQADAKKDIINPVAFPSMGSGYVLPLPWLVAEPYLPQSLWIALLGSL